MTLVELMVVVAVIGVLSAMFIARMGEARRDTADARAVQFLDHLRGAVMQYEAKTGVFPQDMALHWGDARYNAWVAQIEGVLGDLQLPRASQARAIVVDMGGGPGWLGHPYNMGLLD